MSTPRTSDTARSAVVDGVDLDAVAAAVTGCPGVAALFGGALGGVGSYLPGRRIAGVSVNAGVATVTVTSRWGRTADALRHQISTALEPLLAGHRLDVVVADLALPPGHDETST